ncbi:MAG: hypothetical protein K0U52_11700 [Gammaproteobacteria bacterium]|nr:hypothetical protein [Gammaproteobacteria bacterium]
MKDLQIQSSNYVVQTRSDYQLEKFVIGQHDTPEMQYRQILIEAQSLIYNIRLAELNLRKSELEAKKLEATGDEIDAIDAEEKRLGMSYTLIALEGSRAELACLENLFGEYPQFTPTQIEANQPDYWEKRLSRQAELDVASLKEGISGANLQSMLSAGLFDNQDSKEIK